MSYKTKKATTGGAIVTGKSVILKNSLKKTDDELVTRIEKTLERPISN